MSRAMDWFDIVDEGDESIASGGQVAKDLLGALASDLKKGATITRVLLDLWIAPDTVAQITHTSYGLVLENIDQASAGGHPDADVNSDQADWLLRNRSRNTAAAISDSSQLFHRTYDLKAQRVLRSEQMSLYLIVDQSSGGGIVMFYSTRVLIKFR